MRPAAAFLALCLLVTASARAGTPVAFVARLAGPAPAAGARVRAAAPDAALLSRLAPRLAALHLTVRRRLLDDLPPPSSRAARAPDATSAPPFERVVLLEAADSAAAGAARAALVADGLAEWTEPLRTRELAMTSLRAGAPAGALLLDSLANDPLLRAGAQWGLWNPGAAGGGGFGGTPRADAHALEGWRLSVGGDDVRLAVADTGIDPAQPELGGIVAGGLPRIVDGLDVTAEPVPAIVDSFGHGTPVAGVMAARTNDGAEIDGRGVAGVCGGDAIATAGCRIVPIKIAPGHTGEASSFDIARAAIHAADVGARAMNLSFAGTGASRLEREALAYALTRGCVVVAAAGNSGARPNPRQPMYPAAYAADGLCIQVGASDENDQRTVWSSYGPGLDLVAPGTDIWTTFMTYPSWAGASYDGYVVAAGTSFAAPFVTGAVGLLAGARPELTDTDFQHVLRESADDVGPAGVDSLTGWGRLDLGRALAAVRRDIGIWHDEVAADSIVADATSGTLAIGEKGGAGTLDRWSGTVTARRWTAYATVAIPDSFVDSIRVWPRVGGTQAVRGDYLLPYMTPTAEVVAVTPHAFTVRGWIYRAEDDSCGDCPGDWIPYPPDYVRFGFTVLGKVDRARAQVPPAAPPGGPLLAGPNPFRGGAWLRPPGAGRIDVLDAGGRTVRSFSVERAVRWDGRDGSGRAAPPGLYFVRWRGGGRASMVRMVKLDR